MIIHDPPQDLAPWLEGKPEALRRRLARFKRFCHLMSDIPGEAGTEELMTFARSIGQKDEWIQHRGTPAEHYDLFDGAIGRAARAGARQVGRAEMAAVMKARRDAMQQPAESAPASTADGVAGPADARELLAVTVWAPWAFATAWLGKDVENRLWKRARLPRWLIGRQLAIHAGSESRWTPEVWSDVVEVLQQVHPEDWQSRLVEAFRRFLPDDYEDRVTLRMIAHPSFRSRHCSRIVAVGKVGGILTPLPGESRMEGWHRSDHEGIQLEQTVSLPAGPVCGGTVTPIFWPVRGPLLEDVRAQYRAARAGVKPERLLPEAWQLATEAGPRRTTKPAEPAVVAEPAQLKLL